MKRSLLSFFSVIFISSAVFSQTSIGLAEMPNKDSEILYSSAETNTSIDHFIKGNNQTWDYSSLTYALQTTQEYKSAGSINVFFFAIRNGFGTKVLDSLGAGQFKMKDIYDVYKTTSKKMTAEGRSLKLNGVPIPQFYEDKDELYQYPMTYGRIDTSTFKVRFNAANQFSLVQIGTRINEVEGEGQLITPYKTYAKSLKLKSIVNEIDSVKVGPLPAVGVPRNTIEYKWFVPGVVGPVLIVSGIETLGRFTVQDIKFQDDPVPLVGFEVDNAIPYVDETVVTLTDTSKITALVRTWSISPATFTFENGTNANSTNPELKFSALGGYTVKLAVRNRFGQMEEERTNYIQVIKNTTGLNEIASASSIKVYPNPCVEFLYLEAANIKQLKVLDVLGQKISVEQIDFKKVNTSTLKSGTYFLWVELLDGKTDVVRFSKR
jgi:hypothetical protein